MKADHALLAAIGILAVLILAFTVSCHEYYTNDLYRYTRVTRPFQQDITTDVCGRYYGARYVPPATTPPLSGPGAADLSHCPTLQPADGDDDGIEDSEVRDPEFNPYDTTYWPGPGAMTS